jgi:hypothetical protein
VLTGDLADGSLAAVLRRLATDRATGCLRVSRADGGFAEIHLAAGRVVAADPSAGADLAARLVTAGAVGPEVVRTGDREADRLVERGYVEAAVVAQLRRDRVRDLVADTLGWPDGRWRFLPGESFERRWDEPLEVDPLLAECARRAELVGAPTRTVDLVDAGRGAAERTPEQWAVLCLIDGERSLAELARDGALTVFEAAAAVDGLRAEGLVEFRIAVDETDEVVEPAVVDELPADEVVEPVVVDELPADEVLEPALVEELVEPVVVDELPADEVLDESAAEPEEPLAPVVQLLSRGDPTEKAALLRELSSLGTEGEPDTASTLRAAVPTQRPGGPPPDPRTKRRGRFTR